MVEGTMAMSEVGQGCGRDLARDTSWSLSTLNDVPEIASIHVHNNILMRIPLQL